MRRVEFFLLSFLAITAFFFTSFVESYAADIPSKPTNLVADDVSPTQIDLSWNEPSDDGGSSITGYKIEVNIDNAGYIDLEEDTDDDDTTYSHTGLTTDTTYRYRVSAINSIGVSDASDSDSATPTSSSSSPVQDKVPNVPKEFKAAPLSLTEIILTWKEPTDSGGPPVTSYKIEFRTISDSYEVLAENFGVVTSFEHTNLSQKTYFYKISAINSVGTSNTSSEVSAKPEHSLTPTGFTAIPVSPTSIEFSWNAPSQTYGGSILNYKIEVKLAPGTWEIVKTTGGQTTVATITGLTTDKTYTYQVYADLSIGGSTPESDEVSATPTSSSGPADSRTAPNSPGGLNAVAISPIQINLSWSAPTDDGGSSIIGYKIDVKVGSGQYITLVQNTNSILRAYSHTDRTPDITYTYRVFAINSVGTSGPSNEAFTTPRSTSVEPEVDTAPSPPFGLIASVVASNQINLSWNPPNEDGGQPIIGYKIEVRVGSGTFSVLTSNTGITTTYSHTGLETGSYTYMVYAINSVGTSAASTQATSTILVSEEPESTAPSFIDPEKGAQYYLDRYYDEPGYKEWFDNNFPDYTIEDAIELAIPDSFPDEPGPDSVAPTFVDPEKGAQHYLDRYYDEPAYKEWFDNNFPDYTIEDAIELAIPGSFPEESEPKPILPFVDTNQDPQYYINRYNNDPVYQEWFDENFPDYTIYEAIGVEEPEAPEPPKLGICGEGTIWVDGTCVVAQTSGGACLIATAAFGSELAPQVQQLREIRDNTLLETESGSSFMAGFNEFYYSFSPTIADWERQNPVFKEVVKIGVTPLITSLSILNYVDIDSEAEMLGYGISLILLNVGMYFVAPAILIHRVRKLV